MRRVFILFLNLGILTVSVWACPSSNPIGALRGLNITRQQSPSTPPDIDLKLTRHTQTQPSILGATLTMQCSYVKGVDTNCFLGGPTGPIILNKPPLINALISPPSKLPSWPTFPQGTHHCPCLPKHPPCHPVVPIPGAIFLAGLGVLVANCLKKNHHL